MDSRENDTARLFAQCYGLALGLALGAFLCTAAPAWRDAAAGACWIGEVEAGQLDDGACAAVQSAAAEDLGAVAMIGGAPRGIRAMR